MVGALVIPGGEVLLCGLIVRISVDVPVPPELVALMVTLFVTAEVGIPEMTPLFMFILRPAGRLVALKTVGEFVAVI